MNFFLHIYKVRSPQFDIIWLEGLFSTIICSLSIKIEEIQRSETFSFIQICLKKIHDTRFDLGIFSLFFVIMQGKCVCCNYSDIQCQRKIYLLVFQTTHISNLLIRYPITQSKIYLTINLIIRNPKITNAYSKLQLDLQFEIFTVKIVTLFPLLCIRPKICKGNYLHCISKWPIMRKSISRC